MCAGKARFVHLGEPVDGVDMRAEVGLLTRNVLIRGEMEPGCYSQDACRFFPFDTFGGHLKVNVSLVSHPSLGGRAIGWLVVPPLTGGRGYWLVVCPTPHWGSLRQVERAFRAVHLSGVELQHMGQQSMGHYPVHFHMNGDVDERGGYHPPTSVSQLSIHHSFSRCITIHGSNGLQVRPDLL